MPRSARPAGAVGCLRLRREGTLVQVAPAGPLYEGVAPAVAASILDGRTISAHEDEMILEAARGAGIAIPSRRRAPRVPRPVPRPGRRRRPSKCCATTAWAPGSD